MFTTLFCSNNKENKAADASRASGVKYKQKINEK